MTPPTNPPEKPPKKRPSRITFSADHQQKKYTMSACGPVAYVVGFGICVATVVGIILLVGHLK
jgi:hypothetical protein